MKRRRPGYALMMVFLMAALVAVALYRELPRVAFEAQRSKEELLIERGEQYQRAIQLFFRHNQNRYPSKIEDLENFNNRRYLRKRYKDPMTGSDEWRIIRAGPGGVFLDSLTQKPAEGSATKVGTSVEEMAEQQQQPQQPAGPAPRWRMIRPSESGAALPQVQQPELDPQQPQQQEANPPEQPPQPQQEGENPPQYPVPQQPGMQGQQPPIPGQPGDQPPTGMQPGMPGQPGAQPPTGMQPGQPPVMPGQPGWQPGQPVVLQPGQVQPGVQQQGTPNPYQPQQANPYQRQMNPYQPPSYQPPPQMPPQNQPPQNQPPQQSPFGNQPTLQPVPTPVTDPLYGRNQNPGMRQGGGMAIGGGIAGVASKSEEEGIKLYKERSKYKEWEFIYDPRKDNTNALSAVGRPGGPGGPGMPQQPGTMNPNQNQGGGPPRSQAPK